MTARNPIPSEARRMAEALADRRAIPDLPWLARLTGEDPRAVRPILRELGGLLPVERAIRKAHVDQGRTFYAQFRAPAELYAIVRLLKPRHVIETGVSSGVSSAHFLLGLRANGSGRLHSVDLPTHQAGPKLGARESPVSIPPGLSSGWAIPADVTSGWDLRVGPSQSVLPALVRELSEVGVFLHDSHHTPAHLTFELETVEPKLRPGSVVLADNTVWTGKSFDRFADRLHARIARRRRSDLVGFRVPG